jgi:hypothetical protein
MEDIRTAIFNGGSGVVRLTAILRLLLQDLMERGNLDPEEADRRFLQRNKKGDSRNLLKKDIYEPNSREFGPKKCLANIQAGLISHLSEIVCTRSIQGCPENHFSTSS